MASDLPGQTFFPFAAPPPAAPPTDDQQAAAQALCRALPEKQTCNLCEAAILLSVCTSTVWRWIQEGRLLCQYANAQFEAKRKHARPVLRLPRPFDQRREKFLSIEELRIKNSNLQG